VTETRLSERLSEVPARVICLDAIEEVVSAEARDRLRAGGEAENLAYVMYTSGTTGRPKGISITQRAVVGLVKGADYVRLGRDEVILQYAPMSFDASTFEVWGCLLNGGRLVIAPAGQLTAEELGALVREEGVSALWLTAGLFHLMVDEGVEWLRGVGQLLAGGEALSARHVRRALECGVGSVINGYGPTESTTFACSNEMRVEEEVGRSVSIGRPITNRRVYVMDGRRGLAEMGVAGEICIGGEGLAREYVKRPELAAEKFVADPYSLESGQRMYRTGDLGRYLPDGRIEFLGRVDHQVKVRGFRIELGEIEAVIKGRENVSESVVVVREDHMGGKSLVAYVTPESGEEMDWAELRRYLSERLPEYMIPSTYVRMEEMPLTANGKVDRGALPEVGEEKWGGEYEEPRTTSEQMIAVIWAEALGLERVSRRDNFFWAGGHSLVGAVVISRVRERLGVEIGVRDLFEKPTLEEFAKEVEERMREGRYGKTPGVERRERGAVERLSYQQEGLWFIDQLQPGAATYNIPVAFRLRGRLNISLLEQCFNEIARRHDSLRTSFAIEDGQPVRVIAAEMSIPVSLVDARGTAGFEQGARFKALMRDEARRPFDMSAGPLMRVTLLELAESERLLLLTMHHIVSDGWSLGVLYDELTDLYSAFASGSCSPLPDSRIEYADFALWQREWLQGEVLESLICYWSRRLDAATGVLSFPTDHPRPAIPAHHGAYEFHPLPKPLSDALKALSKTEGVTLFMLMLAAFKVLLHCYTGESDIVVGSSTANRTSRDIEGLIGYFVNALALHTSMGGDPSFIELLGRVREAALGAYAHEALPFEKLVEAVRPRRDLSYNPLFQVMFELQSFPKVPALGGVSLSRVAVDQGAAHFDMTVTVEPTVEEMIVIVQYDTDLFDRNTILQILGRYQTLLETITANPKRRLYALKNAIGVSPDQSFGDITPQPVQEAGPRNIKEELFRRRSQLSARRDRLTPSQQARLDRRLRGEE
jgi:amino acid adenylation domain-containing protein